MRDRLVTAGRLIRPVLDALYNASGVLAAIALLAILVIIVAQMVARWTAVSFPGGTDYAGYAMASASFFAFSYALNHGSHIRVSLFLQRLGGGPGADLGQPLREPGAITGGFLPVARFARVAMGAPSETRARRRPGPG